ncbi:MAG TPA: acylphosphatase, partial [Vineibacter sp.]|nr:acylphosphatase [Vineibacter sp.]
RGRVQGVGYRDWTQRRAVGQALRGWVRNRTDGSVEALFIGARTTIDRMIADCWHGPSLARVDSIESEPADVAACDDFTFKATV